jgi:hypothetical protein
MPQEQTTNGTVYFNFLFVIFKETKVCCYLLKPGPQKVYSARSMTKNASDPIEMLTIFASLFYLHNTYV